MLIISGCRTNIDNTTDSRFLIPVNSAKDKLTDLGFVPVLWDTSNNFYSRTNCKIKNEADSRVIRTISDKLAGE